MTFAWQRGIIYIKYLFLPRYWLRRETERNIQTVFAPEFPAGSRENEETVP